MDEKMRIDHAGHVTTKPWPTQFDNDPSKLVELTGKIPKREWFGLTAKDLAEIPPSCYEGAIWADAKLQEKNARLLRERLAQPKQEPVDWQGVAEDQAMTIAMMKMEQKREWVGLTDEEKEAATGWSVEHIEAKLKEKNT